MYNFEWINVRQQMPYYPQFVLVTDGINVAINCYEQSIFTPVRIVRGSTANIIPVAWYPLNEIVLPEQ